MSFGWPFGLRREPFVLRRSLIWRTCVRGILVVAPMTLPYLYAAIKHRSRYC